jgi:hypothetical protein
MTIFGLFSTGAHVTMSHFFSVRDEPDTPANDLDLPNPLNDDE